MNFCQRVFPPLQELTQCCVTMKDSSIKQFRCIENAEGVELLANIVDFIRQSIFSYFYPVRVFIQHQSLVKMIKIKRKELKVDKEVHYVLDQLNLSGNYGQVLGSAGGLDISPFNVRKISGAI